MTELETFKLQSYLVVLFKNAKVNSLLLIMAIFNRCYTIFPSLLLNAGM